MSGILPQQVLFAAGGDVLQKYGTIVKRYAPPSRGGEIAYTFARTGTAWWLNSAGLLQPAAANIARVEWGTDPVSTALQPYLLLENAATNVVLQNRDMTQAAWTKTTMTPALDQVGIDGGTNTASSLLATAGNATCLQAITLASSARFQTAWVKRLIGSGTVNMTTDNGVTWTAITLTTAWTRVSIPTQTLANPTVGFRLVTNGDKIAVDGVQNETGTFQTSTIFTTSAAVTRNADSFSVPWYVGPGGLWLYARFLERNTDTVGTYALANIGNAVAPFAVLFSQAGFYKMQVQGGGAGTVTSFVTQSPVFGNVVELLGTISPAGVVQITLSRNGGAEVQGTASGASALPTAWNALILYINSQAAGFTSYMALSRLMAGLGPGTLVSTIADAHSVPI